MVSLQKGHYKFQFTQFAWTHMALYLIVVQAHFIMNNIFEGMIWFFLPVSLVITNDIFAYICGITFGRTQLIKISPKKTVEGFIGAWVFTVIFGLFLTNIMMRYTYFICPVNVGPPCASPCPLPRLTFSRISAQAFSRGSSAISIRSSYPTLTACPLFRRTGHISPAR